VKVQPEESVEEIVISEVKPEVVMAETEVKEEEPVQVTKPKDQ